MIRYALNCGGGHAFESWFQSSEAYDRQVKRGLVACPVCGSEKVQKAIMAPRLGGSGKRKDAADTGEAAPAKAEESAPVAMLSPVEQELRRKLKELRDHIVGNADYVGQRFPDEARRMHYGESEHRSIYGEATAEDAAALADEGIEFHHLPRLPDERN